MAQPVIPEHTSAEDRMLFADAAMAAAGERVDDTYDRGLLWQVAAGELSVEQSLDLLRRHLADRR